MTYWDEYGDEPDDGSGDGDVEYFTDDELAGGAGAAGGGGAAGGSGDEGGSEGRGGPRWLELIVAIVAAIAVVALIVTVTSNDDDDGDEVATDEDSTTSSSRRTTTTRKTTTSSSSTTLGVDPASTIAGAGSSTSTTKKGASGGGGGTSTTKKVTTPPGPASTVYANKEPRCAEGSSGGPQAPFAGWPDLWQTEPKTNDPTHISVCVDDYTPAVGQEVVVSVRGDDDDAQFDPGRGCGWQVTFNGEAPQTCGASFPGGAQPTPTEKFGGGFFKEARFTYTGQGSFTIRGKVVSGTPGPINPYSGEASASLTVQVHG